MNMPSAQMGKQIVESANTGTFTPNHDCIFCQSRDLTIVAENGFAFAVLDKFPARPLHMLIIPKRHVTDIFETRVEEREAIHELAVLCRKTICEKDPGVRGFNFGSNVGEAAGQKIFHAHVHLIPRRSGDAELPSARPD
jgi:diadenosine tetraphosphate (Ap4A) HIT family hydrolase